MNSTKRENKIISPAGYKSYPPRKLVIECCLISKAVNIPIVNSRFLDVHNVFVLCHFTLIFGTQVPCLDWNSLLKFILIYVRRYPAPIFFLLWIIYLRTGKFIRFSVHFCEFWQTCTLYNHTAIKIKNFAITPKHPLMLLCTQPFPQPQILVNSD